MNLTSLIVRLFIRDSENVSNPAVRSRYGTVSSVVGIICNIFLASLKFIMGLLSGSIAIKADAVNNLSDTASSIVTLIGFRLSSKPADKKHPYGHGRIEYVCGLIIAFLVLLIGVEIIKSSVLRIISRETVEYNPLIAAGLVVSIAVKLWMNFFNRKLGKKIGSSAMCAAAADSISDAVATTVTLISVIIARFTSLPIDGYVGVLAGAFVVSSGAKIISDTLTPLLGKAPSADLIDNIKREVLSNEKIHGIHDLIIHEYGPGKIFASLHAEVSSKEDIMEIHGVIDSLEAAVDDKLGIELVIHMDPLEVESEEVCKIRDSVGKAVKKLDKSFSIHDFRIVPRGEHKNILFDVSIPIDYRAPDDVVMDMVTVAVSSLDKSFIVKPSIDRNLF